MSGAVIGTQKCPDCDGTIAYTESKTGGITGCCNICGGQHFHRAPKAVDGCKRRLAAGKKPAAESADTPAREAFDMSKL
jgi:hypothetical protein